ncbi:hypothetical protein ACFHYQ_16675 [Sphaerimonospora cavernae]|uniref:Diaminopimelate decarboxylase n=1 Tax=Sphaerimonospora cavernae TaxID=1740611 RepID=A0ABV6U7F6_9ACTN
MIKAWQEEFRCFTLAYSYKTNPLSDVTRLLRSCGAGAEVVSGAELTAALADGFTPEQVYFDGPVKLREELDAAVEAGVSVQADSLQEVQALADLARRGASPRVCLRLAVRRNRWNWSRFGLTPEEMGRARRLLADAGVRILGVHFNTGRHPLDAGPYQAVLRQWREPLRELHAQITEPLVLDIGGGFPAASCAPGAKLPPWSVYAEGVAEECRSLGLPPDDLHLIIEPGRSLVEDHAVLVASVAVRKQRRRRDLVVLDCGTNLVRSINAWHHPVEFVGMDQVPVPYDVYGSMCYESDLFARGVSGPAHLGPGDRVLIGAAGGYDIPSANVWVRPRPPVFAVSSSAEGLIVLREAGVDIR